MIGMPQRKRIKDKKPTIRSRYPRSPAQLVKFHVGKNKNHSHHYFWHLCFDVVVKLVPLCLDLCTNWLIIKCTPNINLFYIIVQRLFIYKISVPSVVSLFAGERFKEGLWCEKDWAFNLPDFLINDFFPWKGNSARGQRTISSFRLIKTLKKYWTHFF